MTWDSPDSNAGLLGAEPVLFAAGRGSGSDKDARLAGRPEVW